MPRVSGGSTARAAYYDRNPVTQLVGYGASVGPHGVTTRATYTVTAGKKSYVEAGQVAFVRDTAATVAGLYAAAAKYTPFGGAQQTILFAAREAIALDSAANANATQLGLFQAGDVVILTTQDASTNGSVTYALSLKATEFDA